LKGHDFSRAETRQNVDWALAPVGTGSNEFDPELAANNLSRTASMIQGVTR